MCYYFWGIRRCDSITVEAMGISWRFRDGLPKTLGFDVASGFATIVAREAVEEQGIGE